MDDVWTAEPSIGRWAGKMDQMGFIFLRGRALTRPGQS